MAYNERTAYMFVLKNKPVDENVTLDTDGDNPIKRQWGYLFGPTVDTRTLAHELGHGQLTLRHTFADEYHVETSKGTTSNLMDYPGDKYSEGSDTLCLFQWKAAHTPAVAGKLFQNDEDGAAIILNSMFDKKDLKQYYVFVNELKKISLFKTIYNYVDKSEKYIQISTFKASLTNYQELKARYKYANGYFLNVEKRIEWWGLVTYDAGEESNPHKIVLFSSDNYSLSNGIIKGDGFKYSSTIFEEYFHASHFLFLKDKGSSLSDIEFLTQTEIEVEIAQAFVYYIMKSCNCRDYDIVMTKKMDAYEFIRKQDLWEMKSEIENIFKGIATSKELKDSDIVLLKNTIISVFQKKSSQLSYKEMDIAKFDWKMDFLKFIFKDFLK